MVIVILRGCTHVDVLLNLGAVFCLARWSLPLAWQILDALLGDPLPFSPSVCPQHITTNG